MSRVEGVETALTLFMHQHLPHFLILNKKEIGVKFNKGIVIKGKAVNENKIFVCGRDVEDII
jgi:hypothetical protein